MKVNLLDHCNIQLKPVDDKYHLHIDAPLYRGTVDLSSVSIENIEKYFDGAFKGVLAETQSTQLALTSACKSLAADVLSSLKANKTMQATIASQELVRQLQLLEDSMTSLPANQERASAVFQAINQRQHQAAAEQRASENVSENVEEQQDEQTPSEN